MKWEEAIEILENGFWWELLVPITTIEGRNEGDKLHRAIDMAVSALTPPIQEQVEEVWGSIWIHTIPVLGAGDVEIHCAKCGNVVQQETDFCPHCGLAMTPEAMEIVEKRMEALHEDNS
jgi:hypothetical protein